MLKRLQAETAAELDALLPSVLDKAFRGELYVCPAAACVRRCRSDDCARAAFVLSVPAYPVTHCRTFTRLECDEPSHTPARRRQPWFALQSKGSPNMKKHPWFSLFAALALVIMVGAPPFVQPAQAILPILSLARYMVPEAT